MSTGFSLFVIIGTLGSLIAYTLLLVMNRKVERPGETTGHVYDGIEEYDNPMPAWWFWGFLLSIIFALGYLIYYPGLGNFPGIGGWTSEGALAADQERAEERYGPVFAQYRSVPIEELVNDTAAMRMGQRLFANSCAQCHGAAGSGSLGYPNLTDDHWQWGSSAEDIQTTIMNGRRGVMPAWAGALDEYGIRDVTEYVMQLSGRPANEPQAISGAAHFAQLCAACHGADGTGQSLLGAPNLTQDNWLYGGTRQQIADVIREGRNGEMPGFADRLGEDRIHILSAYVRSLSR